MGFFSSIKKAAKSVAKKASSTASVMHLDALAKAADVTKMVTDPKGYLTSTAGAVTKDAKFAASVGSRYVSGQWGSLGKEAFGDTAKALGAGKSLQAKVAGLGGTVGDAYAAAKGGNLDSLANLAQGSADVNFGSLIKKAASAVTGAKGAVASIAGPAAQALQSYQKGGIDGLTSDAMRASGATGIINDPAGSLTSGLFNLAASPAKKQAAASDKKVSSSSARTVAGGVNKGLTRNAGQGGQASNNSLLATLLSIFGL